MLRSQGLRKLFIISHDAFRSHHRYSTICSLDGSAETHLAVDYQIDSLRSCKQEAVAVSVSSKSKVTHLKSATNSDLVVSIFKSYGLDDTQIRDIISSVPKILKVNANKTLEPKIRVFFELGLSGSDLVKLLKKNPDVFAYGLHTRIIPGLAFIRKLVGSNENVIEVVNKSRWLYLKNNAIKRISENVFLLQNYGLLNERIVKFIVSNPDRLMVKPEWLESRLRYVEEKLGISCSSHCFIHGMSVALWCKESEIEKRMQVFRRFGWSDSEVSALLTAQPHCLNKSEANISNKLNFFMKELGYTPSYLTRCHLFFTLSLEKRVKPRNEILNTLKEKKLINEKLTLISVASYSELKFLDFVQSFENAIPGICGSYMNSVRSKSKAE